MKVFIPKRNLRAIPDIRPPVASTECVVSVASGKLHLEPVRANVDRDHRE
jgi:hypothetical protein